MKSTSPLSKSTAAKRSVQNVEFKGSKGKTITVKRRAPKTNIMCSNQLNIVLRSKILELMAGDDIKNLCLTCKSCYSNFCENENLWNGLNNKKYGEKAPSKKDNINFYVGRSLWHLNLHGDREKYDIEEHIKDCIELQPYIYVLTWSKQLVIYYYDAIIRLEKPDNIDKIEQFGPDIILTMGQDVAILTSALGKSSIKIIGSDIMYYGYEKDVKETIFFVTKSGCFTQTQGSMINEQLYTIKSQTGPLGLPMLYVSINGKDESLNVKFIKFISETPKYGEYGIILLQSGELYMFYTYIRISYHDGTVSFTKLADNVTLANVSKYGQDGWLIYWCTLNGLLYVFNDETLHKGETGKIISDYISEYDLGSPVIKFVNSTNGMRLHMMSNFIGLDHTDTMFIQTQNGDLYVDNYYPYIYTGEEPTPLDSPVKVQSNVVNFSTESSDFLFQN